MYKLLVVTDKQEVADVFAGITKWEQLGFHTPHYRHSAADAIDCLHKHHVNGIAIALSDPHEEETLMDGLDAENPYLSIFSVGSTSKEQKAHLAALAQLQNELHADYSDDDYDEAYMMSKVRYDFMDHLLSGQYKNPEEVKAGLKLLRSHVSITSPCVLIDMETTQGDEYMAGKWRYGAARLEVALRNFFTVGNEGILFFVCVMNTNDIRLLACPIKGNQIDEDTLAEQVVGFTQETNDQIRDYLGLELSVKSVRILKNLLSLCCLDDKMEE